MKKIALLVTLAALVVPGAALAQQMTPAVQLTESATPAPNTLMLFRDTKQPAPAQAQRVNWFWGADGYPYGNICQTPYFWVALPQFYLVGSGCYAFAPGYGSANGYIAQR